MLGNKGLKTAIAIVSVAMAAGLVMQIKGSAGSETSNVVPRYQASVISTMTVNNAQSDSIFGLPEAAIIPLSHAKDEEAVASISAQHMERKAPELGTLQAVPIGECQTEMTASLDVVAMVDLNVSSNCHRSSFFLIDHMGMVFSGKTDAAGNASVRVPALFGDATFAISFDNMEAARVSINVPAADQYNRAILQWRGRDNLQLHAFEFGAKIGDPGHIWTASTSSAEQAMAGKHGFAMRLGTAEADDPHMAEIYTFPSDLKTRDEMISLQVGALVTQQNCGRSLRAEALQTYSGQFLDTGDLRIPMLNCDAVGRSILMPNMFHDLTMAAR